MVKNYLELTGIYQKKDFSARKQLSLTCRSSFVKGQKLEVEGKVNYISEKALSVFYGNAFEKAEKNCGQFTNENYRQKSLYLQFQLIY